MMTAMTFWSPDCSQLIWLTRHKRITSPMHFTRELHTSAMCELLKHLPIDLHKLRFDSSYLCFETFIRFSILKWFWFVLISFQYSIEFARIYAKRIRFLTMFSEYSTNSTEHDSKWKSPDWLWLNEIFFDHYFRIELKELCNGGIISSGLVRHSA